MASYIETLFHEVADLDREEANRILEERCLGAPARRAAVEKLLQRERELTPGFLQPDVRLAALLVKAAHEALGDPRAWAKPLAINERVGRFVVLEQIGQGAAGSVYLAQDEALERRVALKVMHQAAELSRGATREARALARLSHDNVVRLYEVGEYQGRPFMAMEWIAGRNLRAWLVEKPRSTAEILRVFVQASRGLSAAHQVGLIHCDFKPENVLVGVDGRVCVADFGVAAFVAGDPPAATMGTPAFMAPEQYGGVVTPKTDQFAFCVALYSALLGAAPFEGADALSLREQVLAGVLRKPERRHAVPRSLVRVLERGLDRSPAARFPSMSALLAALEQHLPSPATQEPVVASHARRLVCAIMAVLGGVALIALQCAQAWQLVPETTCLLVIPAVALLVHAVAAGVLREKLLGNPFSRKVAAMIWLGGITVLLHRLIAFRFGQPVPEVVAVDLLMLGLEQLIAAMLLARVFAFPALVTLGGSVVAILAPTHAASTMLGAVIAAYAAPLVLRALDREHTCATAP